MKTTVEMFPRYRIAYVRQVGPYGPANTKAMEALKKWAAAKLLLTESAILFGIPQDNPETTLPENCRYDACIVIDDTVLLDDAVCEGELSGGMYLSCTIRHTAEDIQKAWGDIFTIAHNSGYHIENKPVLEKYTGSQLANDCCDICVPIMPASR